MKYRTSRETHSQRLAVGLGWIGVGLGLALVVRQMSSKRAGHSRAKQEVDVTEAITVNRSIEEVYRFWRNFENFPRFMRNIESIVASGRGSRWRVVGPAGVRVEWEAELVEDRENERLSWQTAEDSDVLHHGSVDFAHAPGSRGTEVRVHLRYSPPAGQLGRGVTWLLGSDPEAKIKEDLRRFKQILEVGEVVLSDGPALWRPAQPVDQPERLKTHEGVQL